VAPINAGINTLRHFPCPETYRRPDTPDTADRSRVATSSAVNRQTAVVASLIGEFVYDLSTSSSLTRTRTRWTLSSKIQRICTVLYAIIEWQTGGKINQIIAASLIIIIIIIIIYCTSVLEDATWLVKIESTISVFPTKFSAERSQFASILGNTLSLGQGTCISLLVPKKRCKVKEMSTVDRHQVRRSMSIKWHQVRRVTYSRKLICRQFPRSRLYKHIIFCMLAVQRGKDWLIDLRPCQHDNGYMDDGSQIKVRTDERTQVHSAQSSFI